MWQLQLISNLLTPTGCHRPAPQLLRRLHPIPRTHTSMQLYSHVTNLGYGRPAPGTKIIGLYWLGRLVIENCKTRDWALSLDGPADWRTHVKGPPQTREHALWTLQMTTHTCSWSAWMAAACILQLCSLTHSSYGTRLWQLHLLL